MSQNLPSNYFKQLLILTVASFWIGFCFLSGTTPLFDLDEGAFGQATLEMFQRNDFMATYLNGEPRYDKPILSYWLQAASISLLGVNEWAFRLPSILASLLWAWAIYFGGKRLVDRQTALIAAGLMLVSIQVTLIGKAATADALLNLFLTATAFSLYFALNEKSERWLLVAAVASGLGVLTKGPVALLIPGATLLIYAVLSRQLSLVFWAMSRVRAWVLLLAVALPWYLLQYLRDGPAFIEGFFFTHNVSRFSQAMEGHGGPVWYFLPVVLIGLLPASGLLVAMASNWSQLKQKSWVLFFLIWFLFVLLFFSFSATKLPHYIIYGYSGLFVILAYCSRLRVNQYWVFVPPLLLLTLLLGLPSLVSWKLSAIADPFVRAMLADSNTQFDATYYLLVGVAWLATLYCLFERNIDVALKIVACGVLLNLVISSQLIAKVGWFQQQPIREAAIRARDYSQPAILWRFNRPSFSLYSGKIARRSNPLPDHLVLTKTKYLTDAHRYDLIYQERGVSLVLWKGQSRVD